MISLAPKLTTSTIYTYVVTLTSNGISRKGNETSMTYKQKGNINIKQYSEQNLLSLWIGR